MRYLLALILIPCLLMAATDSVIIRVWDVDGVIQDSYLSDADPDVNYGTSTALQSGFTAGNYFHTIIRIHQFIDSVLLDSATITGGRLDLYGAVAGGTTDLVSSEVMPVGWIDTALGSDQNVCWNYWANKNFSPLDRLWQTAGGLFAGCTPNTADGTGDDICLSQASDTVNPSAGPAVMVSWDIDATTLIKWNDSRDSSNGMLIYPEGAGENTNASFFSSNYTTDTTKRPKFVVFFDDGLTPPATVLIERQGPAGGDVRQSPIGSSPRQKP